MTNRESIVLRALRVGVTTGLLTALAVWGHTRGGGASVTPVAVAVVALLTTPLAWFATNPGTSRARLLGLVALAQALGHAALMAHPAGLTGAGGHHHLGTGALAAQFTPGAAMGDTGSAAAHVGAWPGWAMLAAHALAALLAMALLEGGSALVRLALALPALRPALDSPALRSPITATADSCQPALLARGSAPRAPPLLTC